MILQSRWCISHFVWLVWCSCSLQRGRVIFRYWLTININAWSILAGKPSNSLSTLATKNDLYKATAFSIERLRRRSITSFIGETSAEIQSMVGGASSEIHAPWLRLCERDTDAVTESSVNVREKTTVGWDSSDDIKSSVNVREKTTITFAGNGSCLRYELILASLLDLTFWNHKHLNLVWVKRFHHQLKAKMKFLVSFRSLKK